MTRPVLSTALSSGKYIQECTCTVSTIGYCLHLHFQLVPNSQITNSESIVISETVGIGSNNNSPAENSSTGGAIAAGILVVLAIVSVSVVLLIIFLVMARRRNKRKTFSPETLMKNDDLSSGFSNLVYQTNGTAINGEDAGDLTNTRYIGMYNVEVSC